MKEYYEDYWSADDPPPLNDPLAAKRLEILESCLGETFGTGEGMRVLDCGSGQGQLVGSLTKANLIPVGLEISETALVKARAMYPHAQFIQASVEETPWPVKAGSFDVAVSFEVIEHLLRPRQLLTGAFHALKPGGRLAITTPYHGFLKNMALAAFAFDRHFDCEGDHIRFFSKRSLDRLLKETGFLPKRWILFGRVWGLWAGMFVWAEKP